MGNGLFNGAMNRYVLSGTTVVKECSTNYISGCTSGGSSTTCSSGQYWYVPSGGGAGYCKATSSTDCPSGQWWDSAISSCRSTSSTTNTCSSDQYWNGTSCVSNTPTTTTTTCSSGQYWNGSACVNTSPSDTPPPSAMLLPQNCPGSHYWDGDSCVFGTKKNVLHFIAEVRTSLNGFMGWLMRVLLKQK